MVEPISLNFRVFTVKLVGIRKFRNFTVILKNSVLKGKAICWGQTSIFH